MRGLGVHATLTRRWDEGWERMRRSRDGRIRVAGRLGEGEAG